jgi:hypothetical protein
MPIVQDTFTDVAGTDLTAHTGEVGATYTEHPVFAAGQFVISDANRVRSNSGGDSLCLASGVPPSADYRATADVRVETWNNDAGLAIRFDPSALVGILCFLDAISGDFRMGEFNGGSFAVLDTFTTSFSAGSDQAIEVRVAGNQVWGYLNGVLRLGPATTVVAAAGRAGLYAFGAAGPGSGIHLDNLNVPTAAALAADAGTYAVVGTAADLRVLGPLAADPGAFAVTGTAATLATSSRLASGAYVVGTPAAVLIRTLASPSDRAAYDAILALLESTDEFDWVGYGRDPDFALVPAQWGRIAYLEPAGNPGTRKARAPGMVLNTGDYRLRVALRGVDDEDDDPELDRIKSVVLNVLVNDRANRAYAGFCLPWLSRLWPVSLPTRSDVGLVGEFRGRFAYKAGPATPYSVSA